MNWSEAWASIRTRRRVAVVIGAVLVVTIVVRLERAGFRDLRSLSATLAAQGQEPTFRPGDVMTRDCPKAQKAMAGKLLADPHYQGEVHWYPFAMPTLVGGYARLAGSSLPRAYYETEILLRGLYFLSVLLLAQVWLRRFGIFWATACALGGAFFTLSPGLQYPYQSVQPVTLVHLALAWVTSATSRDAGPRRRRAALVAFGTSLGALGIWHGATFFAFLPTSALLVVATTFRPTARATTERRGALAELTCFAVPVVALLSLMLVPQLLRHGHLQMAGSARLWLENYYSDGRDFAGLATLRFFPRGTDLVLDALFGLIVVGDRRWRWPGLWLLASAAIALFLAHLGFVLHDPTHPTLAAVAARLLPAPPHTFRDLFGFLQTWMHLLATGYAVRSAVQHAASSLPALLGRHDLAANERPPAGLGMPVATLIMLAALAFARPTPQPFSYRGESRALIGFAGRIAPLVANTNLWTLERWDLACYADVSLLYLPSDDHTNHYAQPERTAAVRALLQAAWTGPAAEIDALRARHKVAFAVVGQDHPDPLVMRCRDQVLASAPEVGLSLVSLGPCRELRP